MTYDPAKNSADSYREAIAAKRAKLLMERIPTAKRVEVIGDCELILGNNTEILPHIAPWPSIVTDPPYGIGRDGKPSSTSSHGGHKGYEFKGWDNAPPSDGLLSQIARNEAGSIIWGANYFSHCLPPSAGWLIWDKGQRIDQADVELAFSTRNGAARVFTLNRAAICQDGAVHPTQKPVALMKWCLGFLPDAHTILDPFMGSGTTGVACVKLGRRFIGIELDEGYFQTACERIRKAYAQPDLFLESAKAPEPKQEPLL